ncbi:cell wall hydrolase [Bacillus sp. SJS]|uniref:cell wall hydrolase n=1 Tax=Bacillus sp. SJS TaxID=1423321 RepID=UPI0004DCE96A|nr:cell wall hydrolase [Bacillus sp. SJS]
MKQTTRKMIQIAAIACAAFIICAAPASAKMAHTVKKGETMEQISFAYIVSIDDIKKWNHLDRNTAVEGDAIRIPEKTSKPGNNSEEPSIAVSKEEKQLLAQLVHAEAKGEPYEGKVAVASVVLNRVESREFPDSVKDVIYEKNAFSPVGNGTIHNKADEASKKAAEEALRKKSVNYLYFFNPETAESEWIKTRKTEKTIGNHSFSM